MIESPSMEGFNSVDEALGDRVCQCCGDGWTQSLGFHGAVILFCSDKVLVEKLPLIPLLKHSMELKLKLSLAAKPRLQQNYSH